jgi:hypothetical protein
MPHKQLLRNSADEHAAARRRSKQLVAAHCQSGHKGIEQAGIELLPRLPFVIRKEHTVDASGINFPPAQCEPIVQH